MPAYFSLIFAINKEKKTSAVFKDFVSLLQKNGFEYKGGFMEFSDDTLKDIIEINTQKLLDNFELKADESRLNDYRQSRWSYREFSNVRLYIDNYRDDDYFSFNITVPENEVYKYTEAGGEFIYPVTTDLKEIMLKAWKCTFIMAVQTCLEGDESTSIEEIREGTMPSVNPFAVVPASCLGSVREDNFKYTNIRRKGILIERI